MNRTLTIDPSSDGTTGYFFTDGKDHKFLEVKTTVFNQQLTSLYELVRDNQPTNIIYEDIQYINNVGSNTGSLFKLFGAIESLRFAFPFIQQIKSVYSVQIKALRKRILHNKKRIDEISYKNGVGWFYQEQKISTHQLDAFLVYYLWNKKHHEK